MRAISMFEMLSALSQTCLSSSGIYTLITFWSGWCWKLRALYFKTDKKLKAVEPPRNIIKNNPPPFPQVPWLIVLLET